MSIVVRFHPTNATKEKYDESLRRMEAAGIWPNPPGLEVHVALGLTTTCAPAKYGVRRSNSRLTARS